MSSADESKQQLQQVKWFTDFMTKYGINLVQYQAFATCDINTDYDLEVEFKGAICSSEEVTETLSDCWHGANLFNYIIPHDVDSFKDKNNKLLPLFF